MFDGPIRGGTRGGQGEFKWSDVSADKDRENYLGHSINAPTGRWQKNKDVHWYSRDSKNNDEERRDEIRKVKEAEADALAVALGFKPAARTAPGADGPAATSDAPAGDGATAAQGALPAPTTPPLPIPDPAALAAKAEKRYLKEEGRRRKEARRARREARRAQRLSGPEAERGGTHGVGDGGGGGDEGRARRDDLDGRRAREGRGRDVTEGDSHDRRGRAVGRFRPTRSYSRSRSRSWSRSLSRSRSRSPTWLRRRPGAGARERSRSRSWSRSRSPPRRAGGRGSERWDGERGGGGRGRYGARRREEARRY